MHNKVNDFYNSNKEKFKTKRQASKYLNGFGSIYKEEQKVPLSYSKRTFVENVMSKISINKKINKGKK
jgi:hypothetical protein